MNIFLDRDSILIILGATSTFRSSFRHWGGFAATVVYHAWGERNQRICQHKYGGWPVIFKINVGYKGYG